MISADEAAALKAQIMGGAQSLGGSSYGYSGGRPYHKMLIDGLLVDSASTLQV